MGVVNIVARSIRPGDRVKVNGRGWCEVTEVTVPLPDVAGARVAIKVNGRFDPIVVDPLHLIGVLKPGHEEGDEVDEVKPAKKVIAMWPLPVYADTITKMVTAITPDWIDVVGALTLDVEEGDNGICFLALVHDPDAYTGG